MTLIQFIICLYSHTTSDGEMCSLLSDEAGPRSSSRRPKSEALTGRSVPVKHAHLFFFGGLFLNVPFSSCHCLEITCLSAIRSF